MIKKFVSITVVLQLLLLSFCFGQSEKQLQPIQTADSIVIGFKDAAVAPAYHRSYELFFTPAKAQYRLYAYDSTLQTEDISFSQAQFDELTALLLRYEVKSGKPNGLTKGCTGGTSRYVQVF